MSLVSELQPDVAVLDIRMPVLDGLRAAESILADPACVTKVVMLTTFDLDEYVYDALSTGASGFLLKHTPATEFITAVRVVAGGEAMLAPSVTTRLIAEFGRRKSRLVRADAATALTDREFEVLRELANGMSNSEIARVLYVSDETVKSHVGRILNKLHLRDRTQAVVFYFENGLDNA